MKPKLKLVYCIPSLATVGGGQRILAVKANYFVEQFGYEVHIVTTNDSCKVPFFKLHPSIQIHYLNIDYNEKLPSYKRIPAYFYKRLLHRKRLNKCLNKIKPDFTILMLRRELGFINKMTDGSIKIAENHFERQSYLNSANYALRHYCPHFIWEMWKRKTVEEIKRLKKFVVLTYEDENNWPELANVVVIPNPLTFSPRLQSSCLSKQIIAVGRYEKQKGFDVLIKAWEQIVTKHDGWVLKIYGDGPLRNVLQQQIQESNLSSSCFLEYPTSQIEEKYAESSIFVLSSRYEGFGLVLVEAMSCGLPVVSFDCPCGPKDIISDSEDGFLVKTGNTEELACRLSYLMRHEDRRIRMGKKASVNIQRYRIEHVALVWKELFENLLKQRR